MPNPRKTGPAVAGVLTALTLLFACSKDSSEPGPSVASIELSATLKYLEVQSTLQLAATARDAAGAALTGVPITWTSSAATVALVDGNGLVTGKAAGAARITASAGGQSASVDLNVRDNAPLATTLAGRVERVDIVLEAGKTYHATADLQLVADRMLRIDGTLTYDPGVAVSVGSRDSVILNGDIKPAGGSLPGRARLAAAGLNAGLGQDVVVWGRNMNVGSANRSGTLQGEGNVYVGGLADPAAPMIEGVVHFQNVLIAAGTGSNGTAQAKDGTAGGNLEIGTALAQNAAAQASGNGTGQTFSAIVFLGDTHFNGGTGGNGYEIGSHADATVAGNLVTAVAGRGGPGGHVNIRVSGDFSMLIAHSVEIVGGFGGFGGAVDFEYNTGEEHLLDGSGPNGEGESLMATTGAGGLGGLVRLTVGQILNPQFNPVIIGGTGGGNGSLFVQGGNGVNGASGGNITARMGAAGTAGDASAETLTGSKQYSVGNAAHQAAVSTTNALWGGAAPDNSRPGGPGGTVDVQEEGGGPPYVGTEINLDATSVGGKGFNGCNSNPLTNGTDGGPAGKLNFPGTKVPNMFGSYRGGDGGDGNQPGVGGAQGQDISRGTAIGSKGQNGKACPQLITVSQTSIAFTHHVGMTACPQLAATLNIQNLTGSTVAVTVQILNTTSLTASPNSLGLGPNGQLPVNIFFNCNRTSSFTGTVRINAIQNGVTQTIDIPVTATVS